MKPKRIVMLGLFGQLNLGNECTLQAMIHHARACIPDAALTCVCTGPEDTQARHGIPAVDFYAAPGKRRPAGIFGFLKLPVKITAWAWREASHAIRAFKFLRSQDLLIVPGTGLLVDHSTGFRGYPYYVFKWALIAKLCQRRIHIVSMGAGPLNHPISKFLVKRALSYAEYRSFRDIFSKKYLIGIGYKQLGDPVCPDLAFSLPESLFPAGKNGDAPQRVVGVGLMDYDGQDSRQSRKGTDVYAAYIRKTGAFIMWLVQNNYRVRLLIGDVAYDSNARRHVLALLEKDGVRPDGERLTDEPIYSVDDLIAQLAKSDIVISPRFHNIILALMLQKKVIALSYNEKFEALMAEFGLAEYCQRLEELDVDRLIGQLAGIEREQDQLAHSIRKKTEDYRKALDEQYQVIFA
jgi:polysaccharide pyruvyl transferase WcaK-like protein